MSTENDHRGRGRRAGRPGCRSRRRRSAEDPSVEDLEEAMRDVVDPELGINVVDLGLVYGIQAEDGVATIDMTLTSAACPLTDVIEDQARAALTGGAGPGRRHQDQLGVDAAVGARQDHRGRLASSCAPSASASDRSATAPRQCKAQRTRQHVPTAVLGLARRSAPGGRQGGFDQPRRSPQSGRGRTARSWWPRCPRRSSRPVR